MPLSSLSWRGTKEKNFWFGLQRSFVLFFRSTSPTKTVKNLQRLGRKWGTCTTGSLRTNRLERGVTGDDSRLLENAIMISKQKEIWFVHMGFQPPLPLKIERIDKLGAQVIGGKTGSSRTGHGETYWNKIVEVIRLGFMPVDVAQDVGELPSDWSPPDPATLDKKIREGCYVLTRV